MCKVCLLLFVSLWQPFLILFIYIGISSLGRRSTRHHDAAKFTRHGHIVYDKSIIFPSLTKFKLQRFSATITQIDASLRREYQTIALHDVTVDSESLVTLFIPTVQNVLRKVNCHQNHGLERKCIPYDVPPQTFPFY